MPANTILVIYRKSKYLYSYSKDSLAEEDPVLCAPILPIPNWQVRGKRNCPIRIQNRNLKPTPKYRKFWVRERTKQIKLKGVPKNG
jgi:hypothetical protein